MRPAGAATNPVKKRPHSEKAYPRSVLTAEHSRLSALVARSRLRRSPGERLRRSHPAPPHRTCTNAESAASAKFELVRNLKRAPSLTYYLTIPPSTRLLLLSFTLLVFYPLAPLLSSSLNLLLSHSLALLSSYSRTLLLSYSRTLVLSYSLTLLPSYSLTLLLSYSLTLLPSYSLTLLISYSLAVLLSQPLTHLLS